MTQVKKDFGRKHLPKAFQIPDNTYITGMACEKPPVKAYREDPATPLGYALPRLILKD